MASYQPINIFKFTSVLEIEKIIDKMKSYIKKWGFHKSIMFSRFVTEENFNNYIEKIFCLAKKLNGIWISTYAINFSFSIDEDNDYLIGQGFIDPTTFRNRILKPKNSQTKFYFMNNSKIERYYLFHIGIKGENLFSLHNIVDKKKIKENLCTQQLDLSLNIHDPKLSPCYSSFSHN